MTQCQLFDIYITQNLQSCGFISVFHHPGKKELM
jgi:hypothetical protein